MIRAAGRLLRAFLPGRADLVRCALLWGKVLVFFMLVFAASQRNFSLRPLNDEIFRSLLRPLWHLAILLAAAAPLNAVPARWRDRAFLALDAALSVLLLVDLWHYRAFRAFPSAAVLQAHESLSLRPEYLLALARAKDLLLLADLPLLLLLRGGAPEGSLGLAARKTAGAAALVLLVPFLGSRVLGSKSAGEPVNLDDSVDAAILLTPLGYHVLDLASTLRGARQGFQDLEPQERARIEAWMAEHRARRSASPLHGALRGKNLLVLQVESLEAFVLDLKVGGVPVTPVLDGLKARGLWFSQYHEQVRGGVSSDADLMTNTSTYPLAKGPTFALFPTAALPSLPRILGRLGYATISLHPDTGSVWNCLPGLMNLGFGRSLDSSAWDCSDAWGIGLCDGSYFRQAAPVIAGLKRPFYAFLVTQSSHLPFKPPARVRSLPLPRDLDGMVMGGYLQAVHYTDRQIGLLLADLERRGALKDTVVAIYGDHQGVHKFYGEELAASPLREPWWEDGSRRLPLVIQGEGLAPATVEAHGGQIDLMPTLLDLLDADGDPACGLLMGRSLLAPGPHQCVLAGGALTGPPTDPAWDRHVAEGPAVADLVIRGNAFRGRGPGNLRAGP